MTDPIQDLNRALELAKQANAEHEYMINNIKIICSPEQYDVVRSSMARIEPDLVDNVIASENCPKGKVLRIDTSKTELKID